MNPHPLLVLMVLVLQFYVDVAAVEGMDCINETYGAGGVPHGYGMGPGAVAEEVNASQQVAVGDAGSGEHAVVAFYYISATDALEYKRSIRSNYKRIKGFIWHD